MAEPVYHLQLRAFPTVARVFNLDRAALDERFLRPLSTGQTIEHEDQRWNPDKTKVTVIAGPRIDSRGLGRGWGEVTRAGEDVTETVLAEIHRGADARPEVTALKEVLAETAAAGGGGLGFGDAVALAGAAHPGWRVSEQLSLAEQAIWEMLHQERLELLDADLAPVAPERWQEVVLSWRTWAQDPGGMRLRAPVPGVAG